MNAQIAVAWGSLLAAGVPSTLAQLTCPSSKWVPFDKSTSAFPGVAGSIRSVNDSLLWDPDGPGPLTPRLVIAGSFTIAGNSFANHIATFDPVTNDWAPLGQGMNDSVSALMVRSNGDLIAGGDFDMAGGKTADCIARWDVQAGEWFAMGATGFSGATYPRVMTLAALPDGGIIAGGNFTTVEGISANRVARWDGSGAGPGTWHAMGQGVWVGQNVLVHSLTVLPTGGVVVGGSFKQAGDIPASNIAHWDVATGAWSTFGSGMNSYVAALMPLDDGDFLAGGDFTTAGGLTANRVARWNAAAKTWTTLGTGFTGDSARVYALSKLPSGHIFAGGSFSQADGKTTYLGAVWDGLAWAGASVDVMADPSYYGERLATITVMPDGSVIGGGYFSTIGEYSMLNSVGRWNGATGPASAWTFLGTSPDGPFRELVPVGDGDMLVGGDFHQIGDAESQGIARWVAAPGGGKPGEWTPLGTGIASSPGLEAFVSSIAVLPNKDVIAGGMFDTAGGLPASHIAHWHTDSQSWSALEGGGLDGVVDDLLLLPSGDLIAAGGFDAIEGGITANRIARWNTRTGVWSKLGAGLPGASGLCLAVLHDGDIVAAGSITNAGTIPVSNIARWKSATAAWTTMGSGLNTKAYALATLPNGDLVAGGTFLIAGGVLANYIARWDATTNTWNPMANGVTAGKQGTFVRSLVVLSSGDLAVGGDFTVASGTPVNSIALWNGLPGPEGWSTIGSSPAFGPLDLAVLANGDLVAAGGFKSTKDEIVPYLTRYACPMTGCYADCDANGSLDIDDFICFQTVYAVGDPQADCDGSGTLDIDDFICFQTMYAMGC